MTVERRGISDAALFQPAAAQSSLPHGKTSMRHSIVFISLIIIALALVITIIVAGFYNQRQALAALTTRAQTSIDVIKQPLSEAIEHELLAPSADPAHGNLVKSIAEGLMKDRDAVAILVVDHNGHVLVSDTRSPDLGFEPPGNPSRPQSNRPGIVVELCLGRGRFRGGCDTPLWQFGAKAAPRLCRGALFALAFAHELHQ